MEQLSLTYDEAVKLLCILERSLIDCNDAETRLNLIDLQWDMMDKLADFVGVNLEEGTIDPNVFEYVKFRG